MINFNFSSKSSSYPPFKSTGGSNSFNLPPVPVDGVNLWIMSAARLCQLQGLSTTEAENKIMAHAGELRPGRVMTRREVCRAISTAYSTTYEQPKFKSPPQPRIPEQQLVIFAPPFPVEEFRLTSPLPTDLPTAEILALLFEPHDYLALKPFNECTAIRVSVGELQQTLAGRNFQFVTASPVTGRLGKTQEGKLSFVAKECFPRVRYVVAEFDSTTAEEQMGRITWLKQRAPLAMVLYSGGKSLHGWFRFDDEAAAERFRSVAVRIGADPASLRRSQLVRCPNQIRDNGNHQEVIWLAGKEMAR